MKLGNLLEVGLEAYVLGFLLDFNFPSCSNGVGGEVVVVEALAERIASHYYKSRQTGHVHLVEKILQLHPSYKESKEASN
nr:hypothetical protein Iba_chr14fCG9000 [Ipomoea batatas]